MEPSQKRFLELHQKGYEHACKGDMQGANEAYEQALEVMEPGLDYQTATAVRANLAQNYAALGEIDEAWEHADQAIDDVGEIENAQMRGQVMNQLAWFLYEHGSDRLDEALELVDQAMSLVHQSIEMATMDTRMRILIKLGRLAEAKEVARAALEKDPEHADFQDVKKRWFSSASAPADSRSEVASTVAPIPAGSGLTPIPY